MSDIAIEVNNLSKRYRIGLKEEIHDTFIGSMTSWLKSPFSNYRRVHSLASFSDNGDSEDIIWAIKEISFEVRKGEILGIIGKNGAGKSTLLKILCRITEPTSGRVTVNGQVSSLLEVGTGFHPELSGRENVFLNGAILGMTKKEMNQKFDEIVDFSGVEKFIDTPVKRYSSGMRVRLAFAVAAHLDPDILLIDEVLAVGDVEFQKKCLGKMSNIAKGGRTILFVSHNMGATEKLCTKALLINNGIIHKEGSTNEVIAEYLGSNKSLIGEKIWTTPSKTNDPKNLIPDEEIVTLIAVRVKNIENKICTEFTVRDDIFLEIDYVVNKDRNYLDVSFYLYNQKGETVLVAMDNSRDGKHRSCLSNSYRATCKVPGDLLNDGWYYIFVGISEEKVVHVRERQVISFAVKDSMDPSGSRALYHRSDWPSVAVRPKIIWTSRVI